FTPRRDGDLAERSDLAADLFHRLRRQPLENLRRLVLGQAQQKNRALSNSGQVWHWVSIVLLFGSNEDGGGKREAGPTSARHRIPHFSIFHPPSSILDRYAYVRFNQRLTSVAAESGLALTIFSTWSSICCVFTASSSSSMASSSGSPSPTSPAKSDGTGWMVGSGGAAATAGSGAGLPLRTIMDTMNKLRNARAPTAISFACVPTIAGTGDAACCVTAGGTYGSLYSATTTASSVFTFVQAFTSLRMLSNSLASICFRAASYGSLPPLRSL